MPGGGGPRIPGGGPGGPLNLGGGGPRWNGGGGPLYPKLLRRTVEKVSLFKRCSVFIIYKQQRHEPNLVKQKIMGTSAL